MKSNPNVEQKDKFDFNKEKLQTLVHLIRKFKLLSCESNSSPYVNRNDSLRGKNNFILNFGGDTSSDDVSDVEEKESLRQKEESTHSVKGFYNSRKHPLLKLFICALIDNHPSNPMYRGYYTKTEKEKQNVLSRNLFRQSSQTSTGSFFEGLFEQMALQTETNSNLPLQLDRCFYSPPPSLLVLPPHFSQKLFTFYTTHIDEEN